MPENLFKTIFDFLFDSTKSWGIRTARLISIIALIFVVDIIFNFSYNYQTGKKLEQLEKIVVLKKLYKNDVIKNVELNKLENNIFNKEHYLDFLTRNISDLSSSKDYDLNNNVERRKLVWMIISSNTFLVFLLPILFAVALFSGKENKNLNMILGLIASTVFILIFITIVTWASFQIPLQENPNISYTLNFVLQVIFWTVIMYYSTKSNKTHDENNALI